MERNSRTTTTLGSLPVPSSRSTDWPLTRYLPPYFATSAAVFGPYSCTHDGSRISKRPIAYAAIYCSSHAAVDGNPQHYAKASRTLTLYTQSAMLTTVVQPQKVSGRRTDVAPRSAY